MKKTDKYFFFWDGPFSQWKHSPIKYSGKEFNCAEQFMMYYKAVCFKDYKTAEAILVSNDPREQKSLGREVKGYIDSDWAKVRYDVVKIGTYFKFTQNESLLKELLKTDNLILVEASPYDRIWGIGYDEQEAESNVNNWGQNLLGKALVFVRDFIKTGVQPSEYLILNPEEVFRNTGVWK
jgi:ribA/ribD-fused uncharacterized protein